MNESCETTSPITDREAHAPTGATIMHCDCGASAVVGMVRGWYGLPIGGGWAEVCPACFAKMDPEDAEICTPVPLSNRGERCAARTEAVKRRLRGTIGGTR